MSWLYKAGVIAIFCGWTNSIGCSREVAGPDWRPPDILLISVDTLRADHLPTYGYPHPTAPRIDEFATESVVFDQAYTEAPFTLPAHASMLTGLYADQHGLHERGVRLAPDVETLAQLLKDYGYRTGAFTNCYFVTAEFGFDRGFDLFDSVDDLANPRNAERTNEQVLRWFDANRDVPVFAFVHYFDVHSDWSRLPYDSPKVYRDRFAGLEPEGFRSGDGESYASHFMGKLNAEGTLYREEERRFVKGLYDAGIAYVDEQIGILLDALRARGRLDQTVVIITSDHGEEFQEHGRLLHTQLYQELVRIPMIVSFPEMRGAPGSSCRAATPDGAASVQFIPGRRDSPVHLVDILPTLAACLGIDAPIATRGQSMIPALTGAPSEQRPIILDFRKTGDWGVIRDGWKLVVSKRLGIRTLFHLPSDPLERHDRAGDRPSIMRELEAENTRHRESTLRFPTPAATKYPVPNEIHRNLEALGYVPNPHSEAR